MKNIIVVLFSVFALFLSACQKEESQNIVSKEELHDDISDEEATEFIEMVNNLEITRDEIIEGKIRNEAGVISARVMNIQEGEEFITLIEVYVNDTFENTNEMVDKYVKEIKGKYQKSIIEIKVMRDKEILLEKTI